MPQPDAYNVTAKNPEDYIYVSKKNWARKKNIQDGEADELTKLVGRPGPITGLVLSLIDSVTSFIIRFVLLLINIATISFTWINNLIFGNFNGILPQSINKGTIISLKWFRYTMTLLMPPVGVFLSKGLYGWFNIFVCLLITYLNYIAGIIYAFVITMNNRYADQYEDQQMIKAIANNETESLTDGNIYSLLSIIGFCGIIFGFILLMIKIF